MIGFINTFVYTLSQSQSIIALSLIYPHHKSPGPAPFSLSVLLPPSSSYSTVLSCTQSHIVTDDQSVSKSWYRAPSWGSCLDIYYSSAVTILFLWGALSDERMGLFFVYAAGPCQRSVSRVLVPWNLRPYFTVSHLRLPFSSPPTTRRVTVEVSTLPPHKGLLYSVLCPLIIARYGSRREHV
jgi:hypothetical protein